MKADRTIVTFWRKGMGEPFSIIFDTLETGMEHFNHEVSKPIPPAFAICYTVRGSDGRFVFEREFKARI